MRKSLFSLIMVFFLLGGSMALYESIRSTSNVSAQEVIPEIFGECAGGRSLAPARENYELTPTPTATPSPCGYIYIVRSKDTLYSISRQCRVNLWELARVNNILDINYIRIGQQLVIPPPGPTPPGCDYIVQTGDNLYRLSKRFGTTVEEFARANNIPPPYIIKIGQCLIIPGWATPTPYLYPTWTPTPYPTPYVPPPRPIYTPTIEPTLTPTPWGIPPVSPTSAGVGSFTSLEGRFGINYPPNWQTASTVQAGYVSFWARESSDPLAPLVLVVSKPDGSRDSGSVLQDYKKELPGLLSSILTLVNPRWNESPEPFYLGGRLGKEDYGSATTTTGEIKLRLIAFTSFELGREYMVFLSAGRSDWEAKKYTLETIVNSFRFL